MGEVARTAPAEARRKVEAGAALFVCAYESEELCGRMMLEGGISLGQFQERLPTLDKGQEIIFYCA
ncbi:MAG: ArsR family transcriptional regulator [Geobacter sp.]|nr:MAG: ArsR family transcriptional regulator [Geobacter sp.]